MSDRKENNVISWENLAKKIVFYFVAHLEQLCETTFVDSIDVSIARKEVLT